MSHSTEPALLKPSGPISVEYALFLQTGGAQLVDVRELDELPPPIEGALRIPLGELLAGATDKLPTHCPILLYCKLGPRSEATRRRLSASDSSRRYYSITGGVMEWNECISQG